MDLITDRRSSIVLASLGLLALAVSSCGPMRPVRVEPNSMHPGAPIVDGSGPSQPTGSGPSSGPSSEPSGDPVQDDDNQSSRPTPGHSGDAGGGDPILPPIFLPPVFSAPTLPIDPLPWLPLPTPWAQPGVPIFSGAISKQANLTAVLTSDVNGTYFNQYILAAIDLIDSRSAGLGYDVNGALTQPISFRGGPDLQPLRPPRTMCVAAQLEIILVAYNIYYETTHDLSVFQFLPRRSYVSLGSKDLRGHIWVNSEFHSDGTADALINFGMGKRMPFEQLTPGSFININRKNGTGHAVTFIAYIDAEGRPLASYDSKKVIGFRYYSSQGKYEKGQGGFGFRDAVFSENGCPSTLTTNKRDCGVIYSEKQSMLTTGMMLAPRGWQSKTRDQLMGVSGTSNTAEGIDSSGSAAHTLTLGTQIDVHAPDSVFDASRFSGITTDD